MTLEERRRHLFAYPSRLARELTPLPVSDLLESMTEYATHLEFDAKEEVGFVRERMPVILAGDWNTFRTWPPRTTSLLSSMAMSVKVMGGSKRRCRDPLAQRPDGLILALACVCCVDPFSNYAGWDSALMSVFDYDQAGLIPAQIRPAIQEMTHEVVLVCPWWEVANAIALWILLRRASGLDPDVPALVTEWHEAQAEVLRAWFADQDIASTDWMREDMMENLSPSWPGWQGLIDDAALKQQFAADTTSAVELSLTLMRQWLI